MYRPKFARAFHHKNKRPEPAATAENVRMPDAKQITDFKKPHLDTYEKKIFLNALSVLVSLKILSSIGGLKQPSIITVSYFMPKEISVSF